MAFIHSPKIVTNGLIFTVDAANTKSYVSGSTTWNNLVNSTISGSLVNGPTFNTGSGGNIVFDGVNDYVDTSLLLPSPSTTPTTFQVIFSAPSPQSYKALIGRSQWQAYGFAFGFIAGLGVITCSTTGTGYEPLFTYDSTVTSMGTFVFNGRSILVYRNNLLVTSLTVPFDIAAPPFPVLIANNGQGGWTYLNCNVFSVNIYNRALSATEILQNYNAIKGRFGL